MLQDFDFDDCAFEPIFTLYYALSIKGGFYDYHGCITQDIRFAVLFKNKSDAIAFRKPFDRAHRIDKAVILCIQVLVSESV